LVALKTGIKRLVERPPAAKDGTARLDEPREG
jgi:hypothetical protein